jgi:AcrR family transcriptional regulator
VTSATRTRVRLDAEARRAQLIELGLRMLSAQALDRVPIDDIAEAAGISRGLLFHYFPTKRDFYVEVVRAAAERLLAVTEPDPELPHMERLRESLAAFVDYVGDNKDLYVALVRGAAGGDDELQAIFDATRATTVDRVLDALGMDDPSPIVRTAVRGWVGFLEESTLDWLRHHDVDRDELVSIQEQVLVRALEAAAVAVAQAPGSSANQRRVRPRAVTARPSR